MLNCCMGCFGQKSSNLEWIIFLDHFEGDILLDPKTDAILNGVKTFDAIALELLQCRTPVLTYQVCNLFDVFDVFKQLIK